MKRVYLDNAATTPLDPAVFEVMRPLMLEQFGNPSSIHGHGREVRAAIERARKKVADLLHTSPAEIFFTSGGTEADNTVLLSAVKDLGVRRIITSKLEHHAVLHTAEEIEKIGQAQLSFVRLTENGTVDLTHLEELLSIGPKTLVSLMHANNEIGNLLDLEKTGNLCHQYGALFHSDTVQTVGHYKHDLQKLPVDFIVGAAHKFHGPKGVGFLYVNHSVKIKPLIFGGAQERNMRGGTENVYGIAGLAKALELAYQHMDEHQAHITHLKESMIQKLQESIPDLQFNGMSGNVKNSLYTVLNISIPPSENNEMLLFNLDISGVSASGGSACSSGSNIGSHVLSQLERDPMRGAIRFSFSRFNNEADVAYAVDKLAEIVGVSVR